jgi:hypothetical protein
MEAVYQTPRKVSLGPITFRQTLEEHPFDFTFDPLSVLEDVRIANPTPRVEIWLRRAGASVSITARIGGHEYSVWSSDLDQELKPNRFEVTIGPQRRLSGKVIIVP